MVARKKIEPLPCLCGGTVKIREDHTGHWTWCSNPHCPVQPILASYKRRHNAIRAWNRWITNGVKRLAKVIEETDK